MIKLIHHNSERVKKIIRNGEEIQELSINLTKCFWELAERFPDDLIVWVESKVAGRLNEKELHEIFHQDLIMASFPVNSQFLPEAIGYIDQLPFVNPNYSVEYPSWRMSTDIGGIKAKVAFAFKQSLGAIKNFGYLLNSMAKIGQQNSLFCYANPKLLVHSADSVSLKYAASDKELFQFVYQHYKTVWVFILFFCLWKYESKFPFLALVNSFFYKKLFQIGVDLSIIQVKSSKPGKEKQTVDVIIPTMGRPDHLKQVLIDLKEQSHLPRKVIVVEQNPHPKAQTELEFISKEQWPFQIIHHFTHKTGACMARNMALKAVDSNFLFLCDDDNRFKSNLIENIIREMKKLGVDVINTAYPQKNEEEKFSKIKQWGAFGSGNSLIRWNRKTNILLFDRGLEFGYGEDTDYGLQLRARGVDIIYHPGIKITHLKAERGGFRAKTKLPWEDAHPLPKPSPTMMLLIKKHYTEEMIKGYKVGLFLKFYLKQDIRNPFNYIKNMKRRWEVSENCAEKLVNSTDKS